MKTAIQKTEYTHPEKLHKGARLSALIRNLVKRCLKGLRSVNSPKANFHSQEEQLKFEIELELLKLKSSGFFVNKD